MKKKLIIFLSIILSLFWTQSSYAQCPTGTITSSVSSTANTCGGNGTVTVNVSPTTGLSLQLLKGGAILNKVANATSPYTWSSLQAGTDYQVRIVCADDNSVIYETLNVTVAENYVPISDANISVTDVCTNFTQGGTISVNGVTGGSAPYEYSFYLSNNPAYNDALSTYGTSNTMSVSQFGTYQIRVKDACGNYKTFTRTLSPTIPKVEFYWKPNKVCGSTTQAVGSAWFSSNGDTGAGLNENQYIPPGIKLKIQADNASGAVLYDGMYTGANFTYNTTPSHIYYVTTVNACGIVETYTANRSNPENYPEFNNFYLSTGSAGCGAAEQMSITSNFERQSFWKYPLTVTVKNSAGTVVATQTVANAYILFSVSGLPMGDYTVTVTDSCGESMTKTATNPRNDPASTLSLHGTLNWRCGDMPILSQTGTIQALIRIDGYVPDRANAVVKIISGPSNVGVTASFIDGQYWAWSNLSQGTYTVSYTSCGVTKTGTFTLGPTIYFLQQSLTSTGTSFCSGGGNINSTKVYNGSYASSVQLLNSAGTVIAENVAGNFTNITAGTYTTRMKIVPWCNSGADTYYIPGSTVVLTDSTTGPVITSSTGVVCEDGAGNPLSTGSAFLNLAGVAPYKIEYKKTTETTWTTINNAPANTTLNGLTANTIYNVRLTDACGGTYNTTVNIKTMGSLSSENTVQPCYNAPYVLSTTNYAGATYEWTNSQGTVVSNTRTYPISNYTSAYDGTYVCKITWTNCVIRYVNVTLNGNLCGQPLGTIDAVNGTQSVSSGTTGTTSVLANDTYNGGAAGSATLANVNLTQTATTNAGVTLNTTTGMITVAAGTPAGTYVVTYEICDKTKPGVCDTATETVTVPNLLDAVNDNYGSVTPGSSTTSVIANDKNIAGTAAVIGTGAGQVSISTSTNATGTSGAWPTGFTLNADGTITVAAGTAAGTYTLYYTICNQTAGTPCDTAAVTLTVIPTVQADDDAFAATATQGISGATLGNVLTNDNYNGGADGSATTSNVNISVTTPATPAYGGAPVPSINTATGAVTLPPNTPAGSYTITYQICDKSGSPCDPATVTVTVAAPTIDAVNGTQSVSAGTTGTTSVLANDTYNGGAAGSATLANVNLTQTATTNAGVTLNTTTGMITVAAGTPAGSYTVTYQICDKVNTGVCDTATETVNVAAPAIDAVTETTPAINGINGGTTASLLANDTLNGAPVTVGATGNVTLTPVTVPAGLTMNADGTVTVAAGTPAGNYNVTYQICDKVNPTNCDTVTSIVVVSAPAIDAVNGTQAVSAGTTGTTSVLANDTYNGGAAGSATLANVNLTQTATTNPGVTLNTTTGMITVAAGTPAGTYVVTYEICDKTNPGVCDTATETVTVPLDSDGDGVPDWQDLDDDNDGILDTVENGACGVPDPTIPSGNGVLTNILFNENFGTMNTSNGTTSIDLAGLGTGATTTYDYYQAIAGTTPTSGGLFDGRYTVFNNIQQTAFSVGSDWQTIGDHTNGGTTPTEGRMLIVNASDNPGEFYRRTLSNVVQGSPINASLWVMNMVVRNGLIDPNITVRFEQPTGNVVYSFDTGDISYNSQGDVNAWKFFKNPTPFFPPTSQPIDVVFVNNAPGGSGNDLAIDDIIIYQSLCDTDNDGDGIPNNLDLDSDNDGIYDAVEAGHNQTHTNGVVNGTVGTDGIPDSVQSSPNNGTINYTIAESASDTDLIPNYIDLDSDGDGCADANEYYNSSAAQGTDGNQYYGTGNPPAINSNGTVTAASYVGAYTNVITVGTASTVSTQPANQTINVGGNTTFSVVTTGGSGTTSHQWQVSTNNGTTWTNVSNGGVYSGATTATLTITGATASLSGNLYRDIVTQSNYICGNVTSDNAKLCVISITGTTNVCIGSTTTLTGTGTAAATDPWTSSNTSTATVNNSGVVTGVSAGTVIITYTDNKGCSQTASVTVTAAPVAGTLSGTQNVCVGLTTTFSSTQIGGAWSSSNTAIAIINSSTGVITGVAAGTATMTYTVTGTGGCPNATATRDVTVTAAPVAGTLSGNQNVCVGLTTTFSSTQTGGTWSSSDTAIATVNATTGVITGVAAGTATMTYTVTGTGGCPNATATRDVTVTAAPVAGTLSGTQGICVGDNTTFVSSGNAGGTWSSNATGIATVNPSTGIVNGVSAGTATITYTVAGTGGCANASSTRVVTVYSPTVTLTGTTSIIENSGGNVILTATLSTATISNTTITLVYSGTATSGSDYTASSTTISIPAGSTTGTVTITPLDDVIAESSETVIADIINVSGGCASELGTQTAIVTITDNDGAPTVTIGSVIVNEGDGIATVPVTLSGLSSVDTVIDIVTTAGTAGTADYTSTTIQVTIPAGSLSVNVIIPITDDLIDEPNETFTVNGTLVSGTIDAVNSDFVGEVTIVDNEGTPTVTIADVTVNEGAGTVSVPVSLSGPSSVDTVIDIATATGTAGTADYTTTTIQVTIPAGQTTVNVVIPITDDLIDEPNETFTVNGTLVSGTIDAANSDFVGEVTIVDNEGTPTVTIADVTVNEGAGTVSVPVSLSGPSSVDTVIDIATATGTAGTADYTTTTIQVTIPAGQTTVNVVIPITDDLIDEPNETFTVNGTLVSGTIDAANSDFVGEVTIVDNEGTPTVTIADVTVNEGAGTVSVPVSLSGPSSVDTVIDIATATGTAGTADYTTTTIQVTIPAGQTTVNVVIPITDDLIDEPNETFTVNGTLVSGTIDAANSDFVGEVTIVDNEGTPTVTIADVTVNEGAGTVSVPVSLSGPSSVDTVIDIATATGTAGTADYTTTTIQVTIPAGQTTVNVVIPITDDLIDEPNETFTVNGTLVSGTIDAVNSDFVGEVTIVDNEGTPTVTIADVTVNEGAGTVSVPVSLSGPSSVDTVIDIATATGTAGTADYTTTTIQVTIPAGQTTVNVVIPITDDLIDEPNETFTVNGTLVSGTIDAVNSDFVGEVTIVDNEGTPTVTIADVTVNEGAGTVSVPVSLSGPSSVDTVIDIATATGTAGTADYTTTTIQVTIPAGQTTVNVVIPITDDLIDEPNETFTVNGTLVSGTIDAVNSDFVGEVTIVDNEGTPTVTIADVTVNEGAGTVSVPVSLSGPSSVDTVIDIATATGTAGTADYTTTTIQVTIPAGQTTVNVVIPITDDLIDEPNETFTVNGTLVSGTIDAVNSDFVGEVTIVDNEGTPTVTIADVTVNEGAGTVSVPVSLSGPSSVDTVIDIATATGTAGTADYTTTTIQVTIPAGQTMVNVVIPITDDLIDEPNETFTVNGTLVSGTIDAANSDFVGEVTIVDNEGTPTVTIADVTVNEGAGTVSVPVSLSGPSSVDTVIDIATATGTAGTADYTTTTIQVTIPAGQTMVNVVIPITDDLIDEPNETFTVNGTLVSGTIDAANSDFVGEVTIVDNEGTPTVTIADVTVNEGAGTVSVPVSLSGPSSVDTVIDIATATGTAGTADYTTTTIQVTIPAGQTTVNVVIPITDDLIDEPNETFTVNGTLVSGTIDAANSDFVGEVTIVDNEGTPTVTIADVTVNEGAGTVSVPVSLSGPSSVDTVIDIATATGTAGTADYTTTTIQVTIPAGQTTVNVVIPITDDLIDEPNETFTVNGTLVSGTIDAANSDFVGEVTIVDNEGTPTVTIADVTVNEGAGTVSVPVSLSGPSSVDTVIDIATATGTAGTADYTTTTIQVTIPAGQTMVNVVIPITDDLIDEPNETFTVNGTLVSGTIDAANSDFVGEVTIVDNEGTPTVTIADVTVNEGAGTVSVPVSLSGPSSVDTVIDIATATGTAGTADYTTTTIQVTIPAGQTTVNVVIPITDDLIDEPNETFTVNGTLVSGTIDAANSDFVGEVTIVDNEGTPTVTIADVTVNEGAGTVSVPVSLSGPSSVDTVIDIATATGTAGTADYTTTTIQVTIPAGQTTVNVVIPITDDLIDEPNETFTVNGTLVSGTIDAANSDFVGEVTIVDNEGTPTVTIADVTVNEGAGTVSVPVSLSGPSSVDTVIDIATATGTAGTADYTTTTIQVTIPAGQTTVNVVIPITDDLIDEPNETFTVNGTLVSGTIDAANSDFVGEVTIVDNDGPTIVLVTESGSFTAAEGGVIPDVTSNDTINGLPVDITPTGNMTLSATGVWPAGMTLNTLTGVINVAPGIAPGVYAVEYTLCDKLTPQSCASIVDQITITAAVNPVKEDFTIPSTGGVTPNIASNDMVNGFPADISPTGNATIAASGTWPAGIVLDPVSGVISVASGTVPGIYTVEYTLCDKLTPQACSKVSDVIKVTPVINPVKEDFTIPSTGGSTASVVLNDNVNGLPANISPTGNAVIAASGTWPAGITLDPLTGIISVQSGTIPGVYAVEYTLCDKLTPQSCATMIDEITIGFVASPSISLIKNANFNNENRDAYAQAGETITYNFVITNTGNVPLTNVTVTDLLPGLLLNGSPIPLLGVGATNNTTYSAVYTITKADVTSGTLTNDAAVSGSDQNGNPVRNTATVVTQLDEEPVVLPDGTVKVYNAVSPNDDGKNDFFRIEGIELYPENTVEIYNRWGVLVYERKGYNNLDKTFKGMSEGRVTVNQSEQLPTGTYYYVLKYIDGKGVGHEKAGYLYINR